MKRGAVKGTRSKRFAITPNPTDEEVRGFQNGLEAYNLEHTNGEFNSPEGWIYLVLKDHDGQVVGGVIASTLYWVMHLEVLWVEDRYRGLGYGRDLVLEAEMQGRRKGCVSAQTMTFAFQAPEFYKSIGYRVLTVYDGYVEGITELTLQKRLDEVEESQDPQDGPERLVVSEDASDESQRILHRGLGRYVEEHVGELMRRHPGYRVKTVVKNNDGQVIGGILGYTTMGCLTIDELWVDERYRGQGYGRELLVSAEKLAKESGCISCLTWCFSFQSLGFFQRLGYTTFALSDAYPQPVKEHFLTKRL